MFDTLHLTNMLRLEVESIPETGLPLDAFPDKVKERKGKQKRKKTIRLRLRSKSPVMPTTRVRTTSKDFWTAWHNME